MSENLLKHETSPYLLQHADNPVHWRAWGPDALDEARQTNKPVLLSSGYAACHWCHVMAHESFEDPEVARVMNELYVNIKLDREERPDVDQLYMNALQLLGEPGGWPLTMFLTPEGDPVWGGTYFPKEPRYGRPGFVQVLTEFARLYREAPERIAQNQEAIKTHLGARPEGGQDQPAPDLPQQIAGRLLGVMDPINGGTKGAPKFPQTGLLRLLWQAGLQSGHDSYFRIVEFSLERMSRGGIYDHLGGGYARYAVDERWLVPHFEKMLYDNALILELLVLAWLKSGNPLFRARIEETVGWLNREMLAEGGAFAASLDADSEGEEGLFYTWTQDEVEAVLGDDAALFCQAYDVTPDGNFEGRSILHRLGEPFPRTEDEEATLARCRQRLFVAREPRVRPERDDKVLADWNGFMIAALARAGRILDEPDWITAAERSFRFIADTMTREGRLAHSWRNGKMIFPGLSSDYAAMIGAALALHEATGQDTYLKQAERWMETAILWHWDEAGGGFYLAASDADDIAVRLKQASDDAIPNPNPLLAESLIRLWQITGRADYRDRADAVISAYTADIKANPVAHAGLLSALSFRLAPVQIVIAGDKDDPGQSELARAAHAVPDPTRVVMEITAEDSLPEGHPAAGKGKLDGQAAAYVCVGETCSLPITDPAKFPENFRQPLER